MVVSARLAFPALCGCLSLVLNTLPRHLLDLERRATVSRLESPIVSTSPNIAPPEGRGHVSGPSPRIHTPSRGTDQSIDVGTHGNESSEATAGHHRCSQRHTTTDQDLEGKFKTTFGLNRI